LQKLEKVEEEEDPAALARAAIEKAKTDEEKTEMQEKVEFKLTDMTTKFKEEMRFTDKLMGNNMLSAMARKTEEGMAQ